MAARGKAKRGPSAPRKPAEDAPNSWQTVSNRRIKSDRSNRVSTAKGNKTKRYQGRLREEGNFRKRGRF